MAHILLLPGGSFSRVRRPAGVRAAPQAGVLHEQRDLHAVAGLELGQQP